jgi:Tol biopolymer transport system component
LDIYVATVTNGEPGVAQNVGAPVNSIYFDGEHALSPDGTKLYLTSTRPGGLGGSDIWLSAKTGETWSAPVNLGVLNSADGDLQPAFAAGDPNTMYFASGRSSGVGLYRSTFDGSVWSAPEQVISGYVGEPSLVADGSLMYFVNVLVDEDGVFGADIWYVEAN